VQRLTRELHERDTELAQYRRHTQVVSEQQSAQSKLKKENEALVEALHKEQDKSYRLLKDLHQHMQEAKQFKQLTDEQRLEIDQLRQGVARQGEADREVERLRMELQAVNRYVQEQEQKMEMTRDKIRDTERAIGLQLEQQRMLEAKSEKVQAENADMERTIRALNERIIANEQ
jgi:chromosome segregation ATPase